LPNRGLKFEWFQLVSLTFIHFLVDMFGGMIPAILPVLRREFALSLTLALSLHTVIQLSGNLVQLPAGSLRAHNNRPFFIPIGLLMAAAISVLVFVPKDNFTLPFLYLLMTVSGAGIAVVHPEGLRAIHTLEKIPASISTAFFLTGGFFGFSAGSFISSVIVDHWQLRGLLWLLVCPAIGLILVYFLKIQVAVEKKSGDDSPVEVVPETYTFWPLMWLSVPLAASTIVILGLLPTRLHELGFSLSFGGLSNMLFGAGGVAGSLVWAVIAHKKGLMKSAIASLLLGIPFLWIYLAAIESRWSVVMIFIAGFFVQSAFPLIVTLARHAVGLKLGQRMAFAVGGSWGVACIVLLLIGPVAERWGVRSVLYFTWTGYLFSAMMGLRILCRKRKGKC
jgi:FSR family fosmidomycin resistance protein-like MFS transporter